MRIVRGLVGERPRDRLPDPPGRVRRELEPLRWSNFSRTHQPDRSPGSDRGTAGPGLRYRFAIETTRRRFASPSPAWRDGRRARSASPAHGSPSQAAASTLPMSFRKSCSASVETSAGQPRPLPRPPPPRCAAPRRPCSASSTCAGSSSSSSTATASSSDASCPDSRRSRSAPRRCPRPELVLSAPYLACSTGSLSYPVGAYLCRPLRTWRILPEDFPRRQADRPILWPSVLVPSSFHVSF